MGIFEDVRRYEAEASYWMLYYPDHKLDFEKGNIEQEKLDIIFSTPIPKVKGGKNSAKFVIDSTASKAIKLAAYEKTRAAKWLELCEDVEAGLNTKMKVFLKLRRRYRKLPYRPGWSNKVQANYPYELAKALGKDPEDVDDSMCVNSLKTFRSWWNNIEHITAITAARRGLLD